MSGMFFVRLFSPSICWHDIYEVDKQIYLCHARINYPEKPKYKHSNYFHGIMGCCMHIWNERSAFFSRQTRVNIFSKRIFGKFFNFRSNYLEININQWCDDENKVRKLKLRVGEREKNQRICKLKALLPYPLVNVALVKIKMVSRRREEEKKSSERNCVEMEYLMPFSLTWENLVKECHWT